MIDVDAHQYTADRFDTMMQLKKRGWYYKEYIFANLSANALRHIVFDERDGTRGMGHSEEEAWNNAMEAIK